MNNYPIVWVFGDHLSVTNPALLTYPDAPAIYVWDEDMLHRNQLSLKRIVFVYECLLELPVVIRKGNTADVLTEFAVEHNSSTIVSVKSISPRFQHHCQSLSKKGLTLELLTPKPFVSYSGKRDLKRASRYWRQIQSYAFQYTE